MNPVPARSLEEWLRAAKSTAPIPWKALPDLELYMDQVLAMLNHSFELLSTPTDRPLTSSMINNYVKDKVVPAPVKKKYTREHLTALSILCMLKSEFTLPEIRSLMDGLAETYPTEELYAAFADAQNYCMQDAIATVESGLSSDKSEQFLLAMTLALEANAKRIAAARLLEHLTKE